MCVVSFNLQTALCFILCFIDDEAGNAQGCRASRLQNRDVNLAITQHLLIVSLKIFFNEKYINLG